MPPTLHASAHANPEQCHLPKYRTACVDDAAGAADLDERATAARRARSVACLLADIFPVKKWELKCDGRREDQIWSARLRERS